MRVTVNGREIHTAHATLGALAGEHKPGADRLIRNGFPAGADTLLAEGDELSLIRRGEMPTEDELEALMIARHTPGVHERVKGARVAVAGLGGLGSHIAVALARTGVGRLLLIDFDVVEPSNLNRQYYFARQIGMYKTDAMGELLGEINPYITVETRCIKLDAENLAREMAGCDVIVEAFDNPESKAVLVSGALQHFPGVPVVCASGMAGYERAGAIVTRRVGEHLYLCGDGATGAQPGRGLMAPRVMVCAGHQATMVLRLLLGEREP